MALTESPLHLVIEVIGLTWAAGFTVTVKVFIVPTQARPLFVKVGVTLIVATTGVVPELSAMNDGVIEPLPDAPNPMLGVSFVHEYVVVPTVLVVVKIELTGLFAQTTDEIGWTTLAVGFTVILNVFGNPTQLTPPSVYVDVTTIVATCGIVVVLVAVNELIFPFPLAPSPILVLSLVQE